MTAESPFHAGELAVQQRAGESIAGESNGTMISDTVMKGARAFVRQQAMAVLASRDADGAMWASLIFGRPGSMQADDGRHFSIDLKQATIDERDPLWRNVRAVGKQDVSQEPTNRLGALIIDLATRRRIRINGAANIEDGRWLRMDVEESYPNCPKYISRRVVHLPLEEQNPEPVMSTIEQAALDATTVATIGHADAFFIATESPDRGHDASHRGGDPGFLKVTGPRNLRWAEFPGNSMYNTLGNLVQDPHAGIVVPDFAHGRMIQLTGTAETLWNQPDPRGESGGTGRFVGFTVDRWHTLPLPARLTTELIDYSPFNPPVAKV
jgi:predicted pyridoxine 5'-phosphate oxidase superfamily flavin-nucleotide-binding protein